MNVHQRVMKIHTLKRLNLSQVGKSEPRASGASDVLAYDYSGYGFSEGTPSEDTNLNRLLLLFLPKKLRVGLRCTLSSRIMEPVQKVAVTH